jgi:hypothetical protein
MRTTITLDADVASRLRAFAHLKGISFKQAVNDAVRAGLSSPSVQRGEPFRQPVYSMGKVRVDLTKALALATDLEDQGHVAKLERGR